MSQVIAVQRHHATDEAGALVNGILGAIVPIGGVLMIFGWISLAYAGGGFCSRECAIRKPDA